MSQNDAVEVEQHREWAYLYNFTSNEPLVVVTRADGTQQTYAGEEARIFKLRSLGLNLDAAKLVAVNERDASESASWESKVDEVLRESDANETVEAKLAESRDLATRTFKSMVKVGTIEANSGPVAVIPFDELMDLITTIVNDAATSVIEELDDYPHDEISVRTVATLLAGGFMRIALADSYGKAE